jgi:hypothetical protein
MACATQCSLDELADLTRRLQSLRRTLAAHLSSPVDEAA